jgi:hypothetical protein
MSTKPNLSTWILGGTLIALVLIGVTFANLSFARANPGGNDFLTRWVAARSFLFDGLSPYSDQVAQRIQDMAYGRPIGPHEDQMRMVYPLYALPIFLPFALIPDYDLARALWMTTLESIGLIFALLSARLLKWTPGRANTVLWMLFAVLGYHSVRTFINGNVVLVIALFMTLALYCIRAGRDGLAAGFLAFTTVKPQLAVLFLAGVFIWAASQRRWKLIASTAAWGLGLTLLGMLFIPDWIAQNISEIGNYSSYTPAGTVQSALVQLWPSLGVWPGRTLSLLLLIWLLYEWRKMWGKPFEKFLTAICLTLVISQWIGIQTDPGNFILLTLPLTLVLAQIQQRWPASSGFWTGATLLVLFFGLWIAFFATLEGNQQSPFMFIPMPAALILGCVLTRSAPRSGPAERAPA